MQAVTIPSSGKLSDLYGRTPMLILGTVIFLMGRRERVESVPEACLARCLGRAHHAPMVPSALLDRKDDGGEDEHAADRD